MVFIAFPINHLRDKYEKRNVKNPRDEFKRKIFRWNVWAEWVIWWLFSNITKSQLTWNTQKKRYKLGKNLLIYNFISWVLGAHET